MYKVRRSVDDDLAHDDDAGDSTSVANAGDRTDGNLGVEPIGDRTPADNMAAGRDHVAVSQYELPRRRPDDDLRLHARVPVVLGGCGDTGEGQRHDEGSDRGASGPGASSPARFARAAN